MGAPEVEDAAAGEEGIVLKRLQASDWFRRECLHRRVPPFAKNAKAWAHPI